MKRNILKYTIIFFAVLCNFFCMSGKKIIVSAPIGEKEYLDREDIEEVEFKSSCGITEIPDYAFLGCCNLRKVTLPEGLKKIGFQAFSECSSLESINFPESLEDIDSNSFAYCANLDNLKFPVSLRHIGHNAFSFCSALSQIELPPSVEELESYAFSDCSALKSAILPANGKMLGELIFNCCGSLTKIVETSSEVPTFDCESFIFDPDDKAAYARCRLIVPENMVDAYRNAPGWSLFGDKIEPI